MKILIELSVHDTIEAVRDWIRLRHSDVAKDKKIDVVFDLTTIATKKHADTIAVVRLEDNLMNTGYRD